MAHRLLHTLVFSSMVMLQGCSRSHGHEDTDASTPRDAGIDPIDATPIAPADAAVPPADAGDPRLCEPGWPTTKGQWTVDVDGQLWLCEGEMTDPPDLSGCCLAVRE
ncbi:MAG: hypothetical protein IT378_13070 [Sandaracinaceae bacterium]|nr:hypothetical protein [Sandaracinaceae bacterium]MCC6875231.1 hypothetical protein [Sandaracinaceae bacterium]